jgi:hypothetical protein
MVTPRSTRGFFFPMAGNPALLQTLDHSLFQLLYVSTYASDMVCQAKDRVHHQLPGTVIGHRSAAVDVVNLDSVHTRRRGVTAPIRNQRSPADGIHRLVLKDEDGVRP